jgi:hypothetical protein
MKGTKPSTSLRPGGSLLCPAGHLHVFARAAGATEAFLHNEVKIGNAVEEISDEHVPESPKVV